jgi:predicted  nucleic acid-binding Zn-ribbon protein
MPHKCTACGRLFPDGSTEMLSGCPDCGGNKFQFAPDADANADAAADSGGDADAGPGAGSPSRTATPPRDGSAPDGEDRAQASARSDVVSEEELSVSGNGSGTSTPPSGPATADAGPDREPARDADTGSGRDDADAGPDGDAAPDSDDRTDDPADDRPDLTELREELNEQFESIRILGPGQYELNLMELYDRRECVISLREDGRYVIEMPDAWGASGPGPGPDAGPDA